MSEPTFVVNARGDAPVGSIGISTPGAVFLNGGLYFPWDQDDLVARKVLEIEARARYRAPLINEGGALHVDGEGTVLVTEECLLNANRNPSLSREQIEAHLRDYLGVEKVIWLGKGVYNDETDGHVDNLACFARPGEVCLGWTDNTRDPPTRHICLDAWERLKDARDARGRRLKVHKLPMPRPLTISEKGVGWRGECMRAPSCARRGRGASGGKLCELLHARQWRHRDAPLLDARTDREAAAKSEAAVFRSAGDFRVPAREVLLGGGNIHCITQQAGLPAGALVRALRPATPGTARLRLYSRRWAASSHSFCARR